MCYITYIILRKLLNIPTNCKFKKTGILDGKKKVKTKFRGKLYWKIKEIRKKTDLQLKVSHVLICTLLL